MAKPDRSLSRLHQTLPRLRVLAGLRRDADLAAGRLSAAMLRRSASIKLMTFSADGFTGLGWVGRRACFFRRMRDETGVRPIDRPLRREATLPFESPKLAVTAYIAEDNLAERLERASARGQKTHLTEERERAIDGVEGTSR